MEDTVSRDDWTFTYMCTRLSIVVNKNKKRSRCAVVFSSTVQETLNGDACGHGVCLEFIDEACLLFGSSKLKASISWYPSLRSSFARSVVASFEHNARRSRVFVRFHCYFEFRGFVFGNACVETVTQTERARLCIFSYWKYIFLLTSAARTYRSSLFTRNVFKHLQLLFWNRILGIVCRQFGSTSFWRPSFAVLEANCVMRFFFLFFSSPSLDILWKRQPVLITTIVLAEWDARVIGIA